MDNILSDFQLQEHKIPKLSIHIGSLSSEAQIKLNSYFANCNVYYLNDEWSGNVMLGLRSVPETEENDLSSMFEIVIVGCFTCKGENTEDAKKDFTNHLQLNGAATLIPLARAALQTASSLMGYHNQCLIPNINVYKLKWNRKGDE